MRFFIKIFDFPENIFSLTKNIVSSKKIILEKKLIHSFDVKIYKESISDVFRAIGALLRALERLRTLFSQFENGSRESEFHLVKWPVLLK